MSSREVHIAVDFGPEAITVQSRIGSLTQGEFGWEAPVPVPGGPAFCATDDGHALILEALALVHFPHVHQLVLALPADEVEPHRERLQTTYTGSHELRNTECRSQRLTVNVRRVAVVPRA